MSAQEVIEKIYQGLLPKQRAFVDSEAAHPAFFGGVGNGKTTALVIKSLLLSELFPGNLGMVLRQNYPDLKDSTLKSFFDLVPDLREYFRAGDMKLALPNGSEILFRHADKNYTGMNLGFFGIDQAEETGEETFMALQGRLRREDVQIRQGFTIGNPAGHNWVWRRWKARKGTTEKEYPLWEGASTDNPYLPAGYIENLIESNPEEWVRRNVYGSWEDYAGLVWPDFSVERHVVEPFEVPEGWYHYRSMDHGYRNPTCCLFAAEDWDGNIVIYDEHYQAGWLIGEHAKAIHEKSRGKRGNSLDFMCTYIDPSCFNRTQERDGRLVSVADEYSDFDIFCTPANNDVQAGINRVGEYFKQGRVKIFRNCENLIWELQDYQWKEISPAASERRETPEKPRKTKDHACDALRYLIMSRSWHVPPNAYGREETQDIVLEERGRSGYGI